MNTQALYMDRSAIGYTAVPYVVGGTGWVFMADCTWFLSRDTVRVQAPLPRAYVAEATPSTWS